MNRAEIATIRLDCRADRIASARRVESALRGNGGLPVDVLQQELDRLSLGSAEHICIRRLEVPLRIRVSSATGDAGIRQVWGSAAGRALETRLATASLRARSPGVLVSSDGDLVVYRRRLDAVVDLVAGLSEAGSPEPGSGVARGDVTRVWAWRRCGLLPGPQGGPAPGSVAARADAVTAALTATPELVPAVLARLGDALPLTPVRWLAVATAWAAAQTPPEPDQAPATTVRRVDPVARAAARSPVGQALARHFPSLSRLPGAERAVLARLVLACSMPHRIHDGSAIAAVARAWEQVLDGVHPAPEPAVAPAPAVEPPVPSAPPDVGAAEVASTEARRSPGAEPSPPGEEMARVEQRSVEPPTAWAPVAGADPPDARHRAAAPRSRADERPAAEASDDPEPAALDTGARPVEVSDLAGLLFLAPAIGPVLAPMVVTVDLPEAVTRLCRRLAGAGRGDPAVRALSGIDPDAAAPPADERLDDRVERRVREWIGARLDPSRPPEGRRDEDLNWVWRRRASIEITPGWIEAEFALTDVDLRIRRALLDADPGWLWWRGAVLRFRYV